MRLKVRVSAQHPPTSLLPYVLLVPGFDLLVRARQGFEQGFRAVAKSTVSNVPGAAAAEERRDELSDACSRQCRRRRPYRPKTRAHCRLGWSHASDGQKLLALVTPRGTA